MSNRKQCYLAGVCCLFHVITLSQTATSVNPIYPDTGAELNNIPPAIIYAGKPSVLLFIDGAPVITVDEELYLYRITNTPYLLIKNHLNNKYYLYSNSVWYVSDSATYGYAPAKVYPDLIKALENKIREDEKKLSKKPSAQAAPPPPVKPPAPRQIIVCMEPTGLIQTNGPARYKTIPGTRLQYAENSPDNIFKDSITQTIYTVLAGRWYQAASLNGPWTYVASDRLLPDFALIPEASPKADILVHVAGTKAAKEAVEAAQKPVIVKADRKKETLTVTYDGGAEFSSIGNTGLFISENSNYPVINIRDKYYTLKNGVWFTSSEAIGPWQVSTDRPADLDKIPITHRAYNLQFAYIADTTADYVYAAHTGGYTNTYVQNNTIVYGTGYSYRSWARRLYYPRPATWGWNIYYDPKSGWKNRLACSYYKDRKNLP
jgi:hypothetical protein